MAVIAKRELGGLWKDLSKPPYTLIFNEQTRARDVWRVVLVFRAVEQAMRDPSFLKHDRGDQILVHGNRFILHAIFQDPAVLKYKDHTVSEMDVEKAASDATKRLFPEIVKAVNSTYPGAYLQPLFKNTQKCKSLLSEDRQSQLGQGEMFGATSNERAI